MASGSAGSAELTARLGLTTARLSAPESDIPGSLLRTQVPRGPLRPGVGKTVWTLYEYDRVMRLPDPSDVAVRYPRPGSDAFFVSGFAHGEGELRGTAAVSDEPYGGLRGRLVGSAQRPPTTPPQPPQPAASSCSTAG